jgi:hypothetical protein
LAVSERQSHVVRSVEEEVGLLESSTSENLRATPGDCHWLKGQLAAAATGVRGGKMLESP